MKNPTKNCFFILFSLLFFQIAYSQEKNIVFIDFQKQRVSDSFSNYFGNHIEKANPNYKFITEIKSSAITLTPSVIKLGTKLIEGIETKKTTKVSISINVRNEAINKDSSFNVSYSITTSDDEVFESELFEKISSDKNFDKKISSLLNYAFTCASCKEMQQNIERLEKNEKLKDALILLLKVENSFVVCKDFFGKYKKILKERYENKVCNDILYEAKILINSDVEFQMNKAVDLLLKIPPTAQCRAEAIKLSELLSQKKQIKQSNSEKLVQYNNLIINNDIDWLNYLLNF